MSKTNSQTLTSKDRLYLDVIEELKVDTNILDLMEDLTVMYHGFCKNVTERNIDKVGYVSEVYIKLIGFFISLSDEFDENPIDFRFKDSLRKYKDEQEKEICGIKKPQYWRNIKDVETDQGILIDEGSLWEKRNNKMILVDEDEFITRLFDVKLFKKA